MKDVEFKKRVFLTCKELLAEKVANLEEEIRQTRRAASEETKSSMGDKYETGRAMLHLTRERLEGQLAEAQKSYNAILPLKPTIVHDQAKAGSLVTTDRGIFYLSVGMGRVIVGNQTVFCISSSAPIGRVLLGLSSNDSINFQGKSLLIKSLV